MMKLKRLTVTAVAGLVAATGILGFAALGGSKLTATAEETPNAPSLRIASHNCFVCYNFQQNDGHSTTIQLRSSQYSVYGNYNMYVYPGHTGSLVALPYTQYTTLCEPGYTWYAALNVDGLFSKFNQITVFGECLYNTDIEAWYFRSEEFPTEFDGSHNTWEYTCSGSVIHFSLAFHGVVWDGELGHSDTVEKTLTYNKDPDSSETVTFYVRTKGGKISVKASEVVKCNNYDTMFAFEYSA